MKTSPKMLFKLKNVSFLLFFSFLLFNAALYAENNDVKRLNKTGAMPAYTKLNLNNISTFIYADGEMDLSPIGNSGFIFPKGSKKEAVFQSGFVWGAKIDGQVRVGGVTYQSGLQPGKIISPGKAEDPNLPKNRLYRVRSDYKTTPLLIEANDEGKTESEVRLQYEKDWNEWPAENGAPYMDLDNDGKYNPQKDIPGVKDALQTIWYDLNDQDQAKSLSLYGSQPTGIELQITLWTYDKDWIVNNAYFRKYRLINKSDKPLKEMYVSLWADPDVGNATDDFAACDTTLGLGFCYNATVPDATYGNMPPAIGFDVIQGPMVNGAQGDSAIFNSKRIYGKKNLSMTSLYYHIGSDAVYADPSLGGNYNTGTLRFYNLLQGKLATTGEYYPVPASLGGGVTKFPLSGDPVTGKGYLDGIYFPKGDRRLGVSSGPFEMAAGDTQEVVYAEIAAQSSTNLASVGLLKYFSREIQKQYNNLFNFSSIPAPAAPKISAEYTKDNINLSWAQDSLIENYDKEGYKFQGYNVYQLNPDYPDKKFGVRLATFDLADGITSISGEGLDTLNGNPVTELKQKGSDSGIKRSLSILRDSLNHSPLLIGRKYLFAINAYTYRADPAGRFTTTESPLGLVSVTFQDNLPGLKYLDTLRINKSAGFSNGKVIPVVIDASKVTGHDYQVGFTNLADTVAWFIKDLFTNKVILKDQHVNSAENPDPDGPVIDGIKVIVIGAPVGMRDWKVTKGSLRWSSVGANVSSYQLRGFNGTIGDGYMDWPWLTGLPSIKQEKLHNILIKFAATDTMGNILSPNDPDASYAYRYLRAAQGLPAKPEFAPFIKNKTQSYNFQDYTKSLPFAAYNYVTGQRYMVGYMENNVTKGTVDGKYWPPADNGIDVNNSSTTGPREWFFIFDVPYSEVPDSSLQVNIYYNSTPVMWYGMPTRKGNTAFDAEDEFLIIKNDLFTSDDVFTFMTNYMTKVDSKVLPSNYELGQNYPNPFNPSTTIRFSLKERGFTTMIVYNILGQTVSELVNSNLDAGPHSVSFDGSGLASGMYIYRLEVKDKFTEVRKMLLVK